MLELYKEIVTFSCKGRGIFDKFSSVNMKIIYGLPLDTVESYDWTNIKEQLTSCRALGYIKETKLGQIVYLSNFFGFCQTPIKQWKCPDFTFMISTTYEKTNYSIEDILRYKDGETALLYLKQKLEISNKIT